MFDLDQFLDDCKRAAKESEPRRAIRELLHAAMARPGDVANALQPDEGGLTTLYDAADLTVLHVVWPPGMRIYPHDHRMWAAIGIYTGEEDNAFYRRDGRGLIESGGKRLETGDVVVLGADTIHAVTNPRSELTGAIHVYGGDFAREPRSQWGPGPIVERPFDIDEARHQFAVANAAWKGSS